MRELHSFETLDKILSEKGFRHISEIFSNPILGKGDIIEFLIRDTVESDFSKETLTITEAEITNTDCIEKWYTLIRESGEKVFLTKKDQYLQKTFKPFGYKVISCEFEETLSRYKSTRN